MSGTPKGGAKAAARNKELYGDDYYQKIGKEGDKAWLAQPKHLRKPKGFAANPELARRAGKLGGKVRRRNKT